jgi:integrase
MTAFSKNDITHDGALKAGALRWVREGVRTIEPGRYPDGRGLWLYVEGPKSMSWVLRWKVGGKRRECGLGSLLGNGIAGIRLSLDEARAAAEKIRVEIRDGKCPILARKKDRLDLGKRMTFGALMDKWLKAWAPLQSTLNIEQQIRNLFDNHAKWLLTVDVEEIDTAMVLRVMTPLRDGGRAKIADLLRMRMSQVLSAANGHGLRLNKTNPADWKNLKGVLISKDAGETGAHRKAMAYGDVPAFFAQLQARGEIEAKALAFLMLNATRTKEILLGRVGEIDLADKVWTVPAAHRKTIRTKDGMKDFPIPLSDEAVALIRPLVEGRAKTDFLFGEKGSPLGRDSMRRLVQKMGVDVDPHGFRSAFSDFVADELHYPKEDREMALQHVVAGVEGDYRRGTALKKRLPIMRDWAAHLGSHNVLPMQKKAA